MSGNPTLFHGAKSIEKILRKDKIDTINLEIYLANIENR